MSRLPIPGQDNGTWGAILNDFLGQAHASDGSLKAGSVGANQVQDGILPKTKLDATAQASLAKADSALQTAPVLSVAGHTGAVTGAQIAADAALSTVYVRLARAPLSPIDDGAVGDGITDDYSALHATLTRAVAGDTIDLNGRTYMLGTTLNINKALTLKNGSLTATDHLVAIFSSNGLTVSDVKFTRNGTGTTGDGSTVLATAPFYSRNCDYSNSYASALRLQHANCNGSFISGGTFTSSATKQNAAGIYVASGAVGNADIVIDGVTVTGTGGTDGIIVYDAMRCVIRNSRISNLIKMPTVTLTTWVLVSGNIYSTADRSDGSTSVIKTNGTQRTWNTSTPTTPGTNEFGVAGGLVYLNLGGTDPNTVTVTSDIVSGYGITYYCTAAGFTSFADNVAHNNHVWDTDGFGIYIQPGPSSASRNNASRANCLINTCRAGVQSTSLPFAGLGFNGGVDNLSEGDFIDTVGTNTLLAPGIGSGSVTSGKVIGTTVRGAKAGMECCPATWLISGAKFTGNYQSGCTLTGLGSSVVADIEITDTEMSGNGVHGLNLDSSGWPGASIRVAVRGGLYSGNASRGINLLSVRDSKIIGATIKSNATAQVNLASSCTRVLVSGNTIAGNGNGFAVDAGSTDITYAENVNTATIPAALSTYIRVSGSIGSGETYAGPGTPEAAITAHVGAMYRRLDGSTGTTLYVKESGTGNTGWVPK